MENSVWTLAWVLATNLSGIEQLILLPVAASVLVLTFSFSICRSEDDSWAYVAIQMVKSVVISAVLMVCLIFFIGVLDSIGFQRYTEQEYNTKVIKNVASFDGVAKCTKEGINLVGSNEYVTTLVNGLPVKLKVPVDVIMPQTTYCSINWYEENYRDIQYSLAYASRAYVIKNIDLIHKKINTPTYDVRAL